MMLAGPLIQIIPIFTVLLSVGYGHFTLQDSRESYHYDGNHKYWPIRGPSRRPDAGSCVKLPATSPKKVTAGSAIPLFFLIGEGASHVGECIGELYDRHTGLKVADLGKEIDCVANSQKYTASIPDGCTCSECVVRVIVHANHIPSAPETYDSCVDIQIHSTKVQENAMEPSTFPGEPFPVQETKEGYAVNTTIPPPVIPTPLPNGVENTTKLGDGGDQPVESQEKGTAEAESEKSGNQYVQKNEEEEMSVTEAESGESGNQYVQKNEEEEMSVTETESGKSGNQYVQKNEEEEMLVTEAESEESGNQYVQKNEEEEMLVEETESGESGNQYVQKNEKEETLVEETESGESGNQYVQKNEEETLVAEAKGTSMTSDVENQDCQCKTKYQVSQVSNDQLKTNKSTEFSSSFGTNTHESLEATQSPINKTTEDSTDPSYNEIEETIIGITSAEQSSKYQIQLNSVIEEGIAESSEPDLKEGYVPAIAVDVNEPAADTMESTQSYQLYATSEAEVEAAPVTTQTEVKHGYTVSNGMADTFKPEIRRRRY